MSRCKLSTTAATWADLVERQHNKINSKNILPKYYIGKNYKKCHSIKPSTLVSKVSETRKKNNKIFSNGGRVLNSTVSLDTMKASRDKALKLLDQVKLENKYYRKDIGWRAIEWLPFVFKKIFK